MGWGDRPIGNSAGVTTPKPMLERYRMAEGDEVHLVETDEGILAGWLREHVAIR